MPDNSPARARSLRWKCRRGMKELDVLLEAFLAANQAALDGGAWPELERLLALEDDQLWDRLRGEGGAGGHDFDELLKAIRDATAARS